MADVASLSSASFWRQDVNWYVQQQGWTRTFYQQDQTWTQRLSTGNLSALPSATGQPSGRSNIAGQKLANLVDPQTEQALIASFQSNSITDSGSPTGQVTSGYLVNLLA